MELSYTVTGSDISIKQILKEHFHMSERYILKLKRNECIYLNNNVANIWNPIFPNDCLEIIDEINEDNSNIIPNPNIPLSIIYEDEYILVINKQPGLPIHPSMAHYTDSLSNGIKYHFDKIGLNKKIRPVNRLDKDTSGLVIFAKNEYIQECLIKQMKLGNFKKKYIALLEGKLEQKSGTINAPISRKEGSIIERCINTKGETSITHYKVLKELENFSEVEFELETGRTHQIRVHSKHIGHPILGDSLYGKSSDLIPRQALHAYYICFEHPITQKKIEFKIGLPNDMQELLT
ncbi:MAG: RluA family pseudouridine synthase [Clostridia bacterium]|nr:RluA family pseudouridine synthase [Clostridia bacterium]